MSYSTLADLEHLIPRTKIDELSKPKSAGEVVLELIAEVDGIIDLYSTQQWATAAKLGCSRCLAAELLYTRHGTGKTPRSISERAEEWRGRLERVGIRAASGWTRVAYDPALNETSLELDELANGRPLS